MVNINLEYIFIPQVSILVKALLDFSSVVRSLSISQIPVLGHMFHAKYFLGFYDVDWASIFIEMLSKKLEELHIENTSFPAYLSKRSADFLRGVS